MCKTLCGSEDTIKNCDVIEMRVPYNDLRMRCDASQDIFHFFYFYFMTLCKLHTLRENQHNSRRVLQMLSAI